MTQVGYLRCSKPGKKGFKEKPSHRESPSNGLILGLSVQLGPERDRPGDVEGLETGLLCKWEREMKPTTGIITASLMLLSGLTLCFSVVAQQTAPSAARRLTSYELSREVSLVGTVVKYETSSPVPPLGAHVLVETASGQLDVHLGNAKVLEASHFDLHAGDHVRIIGEYLASESGSFFAARIIQKGLQAVAVRTTKGFLTRPGPGTSPSQTEQLRGVR
jgi:hypothetical protein